MVERLSRAPTGALAAAGSICSLAAAHFGHGGCCGHGTAPRQPTTVSDGSWSTEQSDHV